MIARTTDIALINRIANSDAVRPFISATGSAVDYAPCVPEQAGCIWLSDGKHALACFDHSGAGVYEAHLMFSPECRGAQAIRYAREMLIWLFANGARIVWGCVDRKHRPALMFGRLVGMTIAAESADNVIFEMKAAQCRF